MAKHLTMSDVDTMLQNKSAHVVVELNAVPVVTCVTTEYNEAKRMCIRDENTVMVTLTPNTIAEIQSGRILEIVL